MNNYLAVVVAVLALMIESILNVGLLCGLDVTEDVDAPRLWVKLCLLRSQFLLNTFPHDEQLYGFISVCVNRWVFRFERWLKLRLHTGHLCGDSSICKILCTASVRD